MLAKMNEELFTKEVIEASGVVLVLFKTDTCPYCRIMEPILEGLAEQFKDQIKVVSVNVFEQNILTDVYGIQAVPRVLFFRNGDVIDSMIGTSKKEVEGKINKVLDRIKEGA